MKRSTASLAFTAAVPLALAGFSARAADPYADGWVAHAQGQQLNICFEHSDLPATGQIVQLLRTHYVTMGKDPLRETFVAIGHARIEEATAPTCATAALIDGHAEHGDHARAQAGPA